MPVESHKPKKQLQVVKAVSPSLTTVASSIMEDTPIKNAANLFHGAWGSYNKDVIIMAACLSSRPEGGSDSFLPRSRSA